MSNMSRLVFDIQEDLVAGEMSISEIAEKYHITQSMVEEVWQEFLSYNYENDYQPSEHDEWMSYDEYC